MTNFSLNDMFVQVFEDLFSYIGINHKFMCEVPSSSLDSTEEVNTLVGISGDMEGNIMFGYTDKTAKEIASKLIGSDKNENIDIFIKSALADFYSEFCKRFTHKVKVETAFNVSNGEKNYILLSSNPTYISGEDMFGAISKVPSKKLFFKVNGEKFGIAYSLEQK
jgi:CheY-specific phosphatase CheX